MQKNIENEQKTPLKCLPLDLNAGSPLKCLPLDLNTGCHKDKEKK